MADFQNKITEVKYKRGPCSYCSERGSKTECPDYHYNNPMCSVCGSNGFSTGCWKCGRYNN